ncbi:MAG: class II aldolase/adducin family protein [Acidobacteria bacterium]|nr:class II aldolase/adducin family protein [Acidobacteriota bacterium]MBI3281771.1 class II aldolase/adducin family protein [Acidobacteriota bacterium]
MAVSEKELRLQIVEVGQRVYQKGWVAANDGNITIRLDGGRILATPTGVSKGMMHPDDLIICDLEGNKVEGRRDRTSEIEMHTTIYKLRPDVQAVVHAHPPVATGFAAAGRSLNLALLPEVVINLGCVPLAGYGLPGTPALSDRLAPYIPKYDALLMANHGAVCYGEDVWRAFFKMETVEHTARITLVAELLGGPTILPRTEVEKLFESRSRYGVKSNAAQAPGCPVVAEDLGGEEKFEVTRDELIALVNEAVRARVG